MSTENKRNWINPEAQLSTAYLTVSSPEDAVTFFTQAFNLELAENMKGEDGKLVHVSMTFQGTHVIMFSPEDQPWRNSSLKDPKSSGNPSPVDLYLYVPDVDSVVKQAVGAGAKIVDEPKDEFWGDRIAKLTDPFGYAWTLATKVGEFDPSKMPK